MIPVSLNFDVIKSIEPIDLKCKLNLLGYARFFNTSIMYCRQILFHTVVVDRKLINFRVYYRSLQYRDFDNL